MEFLEGKVLRHKLGLSNAQYLDAIPHILSLHIPLVHTRLWPLHYLKCLVSWCESSEGKVTIRGIRDFASQDNTAVLVEGIKRDFLSELTAQEAFTLVELAWLLSVDRARVRRWVNFKTPLLQETLEEARMAGRRVRCFTSAYLLEQLVWDPPKRA